MLTQVVAGRVYDYSHCVGEYMGGMEWPGEGFALPVATAVGAGDVVYVLSRGMESTGYGDPLEPRAFGVRVGKFHMPPEPGAERHLATFGSFGAGERPVRMAGRDRPRHRRQRLRHGRVVEPRVGLRRRRRRRCGRGARRVPDPGQLDRPSGIAIDSRDNVYVVDSLNHRVQRLTPDGGYVGEWGGYGRRGRHVRLALGRHRRRRRGTSTSPTTRTTVSSASPRRANSWPNTAPRARARASSTARPTWPSIRRATSTSRTGPTAGCRCSTGRAAFLATLAGDAQELSAWAKADRRREPRHPEGAPQGEPGAGVAVRAADRRHLRRCPLAAHRGRHAALPPAALHQAARLRRSPG